MQEGIQQAALLEDGHGAGSKQERHKLVVGAGRGEYCLVGREEGISPASWWILPETDSSASLFLISAHN